MPRPKEEWIKLHTKIVQNPFLVHDATATMVFIKLLLLSKQVGDLKGQWFGSVRKLATEDIFPMNYSTLYKALQRLEVEGMIKQQSKQRYTLITICNWHNYQGRQEAVNNTHGKHTVSTRGATYPSKKRAELELDIDIRENVKKEERASLETVRKIREQLMRKGIIKNV